MKRFSDLRTFCDLFSEANPTQLINSIQRYTITNPIPKIIEDVPEHFSLDNAISNLNIISPKSNKAY